MTGWLWLRRWLVWLARPRLLWLSLALGAITLVVLWCDGTDGKAIRLWGMLLQLLSIALVMVGLLGTARLFNKPDPLAYMRLWWQQRPRRSVGISASSISTIGLGGEAYMTVRSWPIPGDNVDERLRKLERTIRNMHEELAATSRATRHERTEREQAMQAEIEARKADDHRIEQLLASSATSDLHLAQFGVFLLFAGVVMATATPEVVCLVGHMRSLVEGL